MYTGLLLPPFPAQRKHDIKCFAHFFPITRDYTICPERLLVVKSGLQDLIRTTAELAGSGLQGQKLGLSSHTGFLRVKRLNNAL